MTEKCEPHRQVRAARADASCTVDEEWTKNGRRMNEDKVEIRWGLDGDKNVREEGIAQ